MFVACKIPNGLIISGAGKTTELIGPNRAPDLPAPPAPPGARPAKDLYGGYAITSNVDPNIWAEWCANAGADLVDNNIVFAEDNIAVLKARAWARAKIKSGFEQIRQP